MTAVSSKKTMLPNYENPPVSEVVCGILFKPIARLLSPYIGLLWERYRPEYTSCREVAPLNPTIEKFDEPDEMVIEVGNIPLVPRIWFVSENNNAVVQVQRDRFLHNWRKVKPEDEYPRYHKVFQLFRERLSTFQTFLEENELGIIEPLQFEMTYVNPIPQGEAWEQLGEIGKVFPDFAFRSEDRFLPRPDSVAWRTTFALPNKAGRLHAAIRNTKMRSSGKPVLMLELTARGILADKSLDAMQFWFDIAREWIVRGFADLIGESIQKEIWKKK